MWNASSRPSRPRTAQTQRPTASWPSRAGSGGGRQDREALAHARPERLAPAPTAARTRPGTPIASTVRKNSVKRGCEAKKLMSNAGSLEKSGGLGNTPCVNAKHMHEQAHEPVEDRRPVHERGDDRRVARLGGIDMRVRKSCTSVAAAEREHLVDRRTPTMYAPHTSRQRTSLARIGRLDRVEQRARAQQSGRAAYSASAEQQRPPAEARELEKNVPTESKNWSIVEPTERWWRRGSTLHTVATRPVRPLTRRGAQIHLGPPESQGSGGADSRPSRARVAPSQASVNLKFAARRRSTRESRPHS